MALDIFALIVMGILIAVVVWFVVLLGPMPGRIAEDRGHPQADAIRVLGWIGVITMGLAWPFALVWAYTRSEPSHTDALRERIATLESELALKAQGGDA